MHPDVCRFVSEVVYDSRLESAPDCANQRIEIEETKTPSPASAGEGGRRPGEGLHESTPRVIPNREDPGVILSRRNPEGVARGEGPGTHPPVTRPSAVTAHAPSPPTYAAPTPPPVQAPVILSRADGEGSPPDNPPLSGTGLRFVAVNHANNAQSSIEEATRIADEIETLLTATVTDKRGETRPLKKTDIMVVAPYN